MDQKKLPTIISNNCWGGFAYQDLGLEYNSPFIGLFIPSVDYIKLLKNFDNYMKSELIFVKSSKYEEFSDADWLIALLNDCEIHFLHYNTVEEVKEKWQRRKERINWEDLRIEFGENETFSKGLINEFLNLNFENKIYISSQSDWNCDNCIFIGAHNYKMNLLNNSRAYFDLKRWYQTGAIERRNLFARNLEILKRNLKRLKRKILSYLNHK